MLSTNVPPRTLHLQSIQCQVGFCCLKNSSLFYSFERLSCVAGCVPPCEDCGVRTLFGAKSESKQKQRESQPEPACLFVTQNPSALATAFHRFLARPAPGYGSHIVSHSLDRGRDGEGAPKRQPCIRVSQFPVCCSCLRAAPG